MNVIGDNAEKHAAFGKLVDQIEPILIGHEPCVVLAALADTAAYWIASSPAIERPGMLHLHMSLLKELIILHGAKVANDNAAEPELV